jgi:serine/threonine protein kinase
VGESHQIPAWIRRDDRLNVIHIRPYRPPELLFGSDRYDPFALDSWAFGVTMAEMFTPLAYGSPDVSRTVDTDYQNVQHGFRHAMNEDADDDSDDDEAPVRSAMVVTKTIGHESVARGVWQRQALFEGCWGELGLASSIFKLLGTPSSDSWPVCHRGSIVRNDY